MMWHLSILPDMELKCSFMHDQHVRIIATTPYHCWAKNPNPRAAQVVKTQSDGYSFLTNWLCFQTLVVWWPGARMDNLDGNWKHFNKPQPQ